MVRMGRGPLAARFTFVDRRWRDRRGLRSHRGRYPETAGDPRRAGPGGDPGRRATGSGPAGPCVHRETFKAILRDSGQRHLKTLLRDQSTIAGVGNAYSDEILHAAKLSPTTPADSLDDAAAEQLFAALRTVLDDAVESARVKAPKDLKDNKRTTMNVHGRTGEPCPVCGDTIRSVASADSSYQYCPTCQTGGKPLADRRMSRLLK